MGCPGFNYPRPKNPVYCYRDAQGILIPRWAYERVRYKHWPIRYRVGATVYERTGK